MTNEDLNKPFFTEENSPVPLFPIDQAWDHMHQKLEEELPEKKKRRFLLWLPPIGCALTGLLLLAGSAVVWWATDKRDTVTTKNAAVNTGKVAGNDQPLQPAFVDSSSDKQSTATGAEKQASGQFTRSARSKASKHSKYVTATSAVRIDSMTSDLSASAIAGVSWDASILVQAQRPTPSFLFPADSLQNLPTDSTDKNKFSFAAGLQWQLPLPVNGTKYYLKGPDGADQWYRLLIPGAWISVAKKKQQLTLELIPFLNNPMPVKSYETGNITLPDSSKVYGNSNLVKAFGLQAGLHYGYQLATHWRVGGGIDATWWKKGLVAITSATDTMMEKSISYSIRPGQEERFTRFQLAPVLEMGYQQHRWEGVLQLSRPFTSTIKGVQPPVWLRFTLRWQLLQEKVAGNKARKP